MGRPPTRDGVSNAFRLLRVFPQPGGGCNEYHGHSSPMPFGFFGFFHGRDSHEALPGHGGVSNAFRLLRVFPRSKSARKLAFLYAGLQCLSASSGFSTPSWKTKRIKSSGCLQCLSASSGFSTRQHSLFIESCGGSLQCLSASSGFSTEWQLIERSSNAP